MLKVLKKPLQTFALLIGNYQQKHFTSAFVVKITLGVCLLVNFHNFSSKTVKKSKFLVLSPPKSQLHGPICTKILKLH